MPCYNDECAIETRSLERYRRHKDDTAMAEEVLKRAQQFSRAYNILRNHFRR